MSMKSSSSANSTISSYFVLELGAVRPAARPPSTTFSRPVSLRLKPTPSASSVLTRPSTSTRPARRRQDAGHRAHQRGLAGAVGADDAEHLPCGTSKETSLIASISRTTRSRRPSRIIVLLSVGVRSSDVR